jgi:hypothetical protein
MPTPTDALDAPIPPFLARWQSAGGAERANYQLFLAELCDLLHVPRPNPATNDDTKNTYVFDRSITVTHPDGSTSTNFIDLYNRAHFVLETKQGIEAQDKAPPGKARALTLDQDGPSPTHIRDDTPPLLVIDVGYSIETYADFSGLGKTYTRFPDNLSHRFKLPDLTGENALMLTANRHGNCYNVRIPIPQLPVFDVHDTNVMKFVFSRARTHWNLYEICSRTA